MIAGLRGTLARVLPQPAVQGLFDLRHGRTPFQRRAADAWRSAQTRPARAWVDADVVPASFRGRTVLTQPVRRFCARDVAASNRQLVASAARGAGVDFREEEASGPHGGMRISVAPGDLSKLLDAVRQSAAGRPVYVTVDGRRPQLARDAVVGVPREVTVFEFASADGLVLADERLGCTVSALPAIGGAGRPITEFREPVDLVYTWVDGADDEWRRARDAAWARIHPGELNEFAGNEERFRTHDELRYSLARWTISRPGPDTSTSSLRGRCRNGWTRPTRGSPWWTTGMSLPTPMHCPRSTHMPSRRSCTAFLA